jgi:hypothetical protein
MKKINENDLIALGFRKRTVEPKESGQKEPFHYYVREIGKLALISNSNDECVDGFYYVEFFDYPEVGKYYYFKKLAKLVKLLKSAEK